VVRNNLSKQARSRLKGKVSQAPEKKKKKTLNSKSNRAYQPIRPNPAWVATALIRPAYQPSPAKLSWWLGSGHGAEILHVCLSFQVTEPTHFSRHVRDKSE